MVSEVYLHTIPLNWITSYITNKNFKLKMPQSKFLIFLSKLSLSIAFSKSLHNIFISSVALVAQRVKNLPAMQETGVWSLGQEDPLEKEMATHSSILAWKIPWMKEPGRLE